MGGEAGLFHGGSRVNLWKVPLVFSNQHLFLVYFYHCGLNKGATQCSGCTREKKAPGSVSVEAVSHTCLSNVRFVATGSPPVLKAPDTMN